MLGPSRGQKRLCSDQLNEDIRREEWVLLVFRQSPRLRICEHHFHNWKKWSTPPIEITRVAE
ncbi:hypothetical protein SETIT_1G270600v2 [Setaria italica]|uniref:Uncharacterized protein n=1 Tax=Setaria italica TaxID=4555 RepID=K3YXI6_SETIT|nr:hypothetical protein SETIT_1G270600v2 [Setaria italica]